ncbi:hypothetical protein [uncultured Allomuricauda sp.]|uniref:hypothetical protein n=1 Tax=Flagellimonas sp. W118 TaxID=3410791 RepID=UPI00261A2634|nr:hypothetical protein [uncultured Allomuricauda sp.]
MKPLIFLLLFALGNSCDKSNVVALEENAQNEETVQNEEIEIDQQLLGPNEVIFKVKMIGEMESNKEICGSSKQYVTTVEIIDIVKSGGSLNQKLSNKQQLTVAFLFNPEGLDKDMVLEAKAKESLCTDTSTYFTIIGHKILE